MSIVSQTQGILATVQRPQATNFFMSVFSESAELYTPLAGALQELKRRREDKTLLQKIKDYFASYPSPSELASEPKAVMAPSLVSPNLELNYFLDIRKDLPIKSVFYEFRSDKFVHLNFEKRCLGEMTFFRLNASGKKESTGSVRVIDFQKDQGKPMNEIRTLKGEPFVDFHHRLVSEYRPSEDVHIYDFSKWFRGSHSFAPEFPYLRYLGLFITDGILFCNFIADSVVEKSQSSFTDTRVLPAFRKLKEIFGVSPLIVPIEPIETDVEHFWCYYPDEVRRFI